MKNVVLIIHTIADVRRALHETRVGALEPYFLGLILLSFLLYLIHAVSPLAPFVYSLF